MEDEQLEQLKEFFKDEIRHAIREEMGATLTDNLKEEFRDLLSHVQSTIREIKDNAALNNSISSSTNYGSTKRKLESEEDALGHSGENKKRKTSDDRTDSFTRREDTKYVSSSYESDRKPLIDEDRDRLEKDDRRNTYKEYTERPLESRDRPLESRDSTRRRSEGDREGSLTSSSGRYSPRGDTHQPSSRGVGGSGSDDRMWDSVHSRGSSSSSTYPKTASSTAGGSGYSSSSSTYRDDYYRSKLPPVKDSHHSSSRLGERRRTPPVPLSSSWKDSSATSGSASTSGASYRGSSSSSSSSGGAGGGTGERIRGTIKSMLHYRGYGHIEHPDFPDGLWFSFSQVQFEPAELKLGDEVEFEIGHNGKAPCANNIRWPSSTRRYY